MMTQLSIKSFYLLAVLFLLGGCSSLIPYEDEFACKRSDNMGKCIDTENAYLEAVSGQSTTPFAKPHSELEDGESNYATTVTTDENGKPIVPVVPSNAGYLHYLDSNYRETARLLDSAITPVTSSGDTIKIVLLPNKIDSKVMLSERTMYVIIEEPEFIMGDYLTPKAISVKDLFGEK